MYTCKFDLKEDMCLAQEMTSLCDLEHNATCLKSHSKLPKLNKNCTKIISLKANMLMSETITVSPTFLGILVTRSY